MWAPPCFENETGEEKEERLRKVATIIFEHEGSGKMEPSIIQKSAFTSEDSSKTKKEKKRERDLDER